MNPPPAETDKVRSDTARRLRRTQEQRTADTRAALFEAAVVMIDRHGYAGANNASIADQAGVSRGAITHHFTTRAAFMAEVVRWVFEQEIAHYTRLAGERPGALRASDWPQILWEVFSRPSGVAVMEILVASRSDADLAELTRPMQLEIERRGAQNYFHHAEVTAAEMAVIRMSVWAVRGMTMGRSFTDGPGSMEDAVALLGQVLGRAAPTGSIRQLVDLAK
ncbi:TetR/AcrR family transcriptional regulator [uncultured Sphingomonas sp.]|uniref:TetR/AcrR family transcriptional regulator n=1 Tax=uncultured Sphingomonas sp. TaxID=158754 RepID=UPI0025EAA84F|nr:TetR/AcrR family transcriptional regulator [uncultured Sphingomonas sp.]